MAKYKLAGKTRRPGNRPPAALPCMVLIAAIFVGVMLLFYFAMKSG